MRRFRNTVLFGLKLGLSAGLLAVLFTHLDLAGLAARLNSTVGLVAVAVLGLLLLQALATAARWTAALTAANRPFPLAAAWRSVLLGQCVNQIMPSTVGGDAVRAWHAWRRGLEPGVAVRSLVADRVFSFFGLTLLCLAGLPWMTAHADPSMEVMLSAAALGGPVIMAALLGLRFVPGRWIRRRPVAAAVSLSHGIWAVLTRPRLAAVVGALLFVPHLIDATVIWLFTVSLGQPVSWLMMALVVPPAVLVSALPVTIAGWGLREGALVLGFTALGLSADVALAASLLYGGAAILTGLTGAVIWAVQEPDGLRRLRPGKRPPDAAVALS